jgi:hypothetical protein
MTGRLIFVRPVYEFLYTKKCKGEKRKEYIEKIVTRRKVPVKL